jgi:probable rRNA maturation factor
VPAAQSETPGMAGSVEIVLETPDWAALNLEALAERAVRTTLRHLQLPEDCEVTLLATDDARIAILNAEFRARETATNVLSWPSEDLSAEAPGGPPLLPEADFPGEPPCLGDIALAFETCMREAEAGGKPLADHATHLIVHGILHLLGYDHIHDDDAALMERLEVEILGELGLPDPY